MNVTAGTEYTLSIEYDNDHTFTFSATDGQQTESKDVVGPTKEADTDADHYLGLETNIIGGGTVGGGFIHATFDDVMVNGSLYDDFSTRLDAGKWPEGEIVREIRDNKLQMNVDNFGGQPTVTNQIYLADQYVTNYFQADVTVSSQSTYVNDTYGEAAVYGCFYNTKYDGTGYNGNDGEFWAGTTVSQNASGQLQVQAWAGQYNNSQSNSWTSLYSHDFPCQVQADKPITLSVEKRESDATMIFHCNDSELQYQLTGNLYAPRYNLRKLRTRVKSPSVIPGYINATIDNVYTEKPVKKSPWNLFLPAILTTGAKK
ncbi:MAG TPA: hypothetical protein ENK89_04765 [Desulfobulbaceae bacterium]|nr:hypothetical protein [Desulfobulbaceae bacterium]